MNDTWAAKRSLSNTNINMAEMKDSNENIIGKLTARVKSSLHLTPNTDESITLFPKRRKSAIDFLPPACRDERRNSQFAARRSSIKDDIKSLLTRRFSLPSANPENPSDICKAPILPRKSDAIRRSSAVSRPSIISYPSRPSTPLSDESSLSGSELDDMPVPDFFIVDRSFIEKQEKKRRFSFNLFKK